MGRIKKGILGGFSGKVGTVVGASWRSIDYMRSLPKERSVPFSPAQLGQQSKMALLRGFLLSIQEIVEQGFQDYNKHTAMNSALSFNLLHAIEGAHPEHYINFPNFLFTQGKLVGAGAPKVASTLANSVDFTWENGFYSPMCAAADDLTVVVYNPESKKFVSLQNAGKREDGTVRLLLPKEFTGDVVHCYLSLFSSNRKISSTNQYLGAVKVS